MVMGIIVLAIVFIGLAMVAVFNVIVRRKMLVKEASGGIDVQLKKRHDLIPNLVDVTKGYMRYEQGTLTEVVSLRSQATDASSMNERGSTESALSGGLKTLIALAEAYPDLKANNTFAALHASLVDIEDQLQLARRYYNGAVRDYNTVVESFPGLLIASLLGFKPLDFFELEFATERQAPEVKLETK